MQTKPVLKWVGGKKKLLPYIIKNLPSHEFKDYYEPFVGGASLIIELLSKDFDCKRQYYISDINKNLINVYNTIKNNLDELIIDLSNEKYSNNQENYYINRTRFNIIKSDDKVDNNIEKASLFIYLNKCSFNGIYRENLSGKFNTPFGKMKNPKICDNITLTNFKNIIKDVIIKCYDYQDILESVKKHDLVYLDPPYHNTFTSYNKETFGEEQQCELKLFVDKLTQKGVNVIMSNSATDFIQKLYEDYTIISITTRYSLGGKGANRGNRQEILIKNYI